jgi:hypothetical protein
MRSAKDFLAAHKWLMAKQILKLGVKVGFELAGCEFQAPQKCLRLIKVYAINFIP